MTNRRPTVVLALLLLAVAAGACRQDQDPPAQPSAAVEVVDDAASVEAAYGDRLEALGVRVTRAGLSQGLGEEYDGDGTHLAVYVEPIGAATPKQQLDRLVPLIQAFVPDVFRRSPGIRSFDICQEPAADPSDTPRPETAILVERKHVDEVDWDSLTLEDVVRLAAEDDPKIDLAVAPSITASAEWESLRATRP